MDRRSLRYGYCAILLALTAGCLAAMSGCTSFLATAMWVARGNDAPAEFNGLKEKKVVVVCRPAGSLEYGNPTVGDEIANEVGRLLRERVKKCEVISHRKVEQWVDEHGPWDDCLDVADALQADMVVAIELQDFSILESQTLYQGRANAVLRVFDVKGGEDPVFERILPHSVYPPNMPIQHTEITEPEFRRRYVGVLADQVGRYFYAHDRTADYAQDATAHYRNR
jgi:hypothetical protein